MPRPAAQRAPRGVVTAGAAPRQTNLKSGYCRPIRRALPGATAQGQRRDSCAAALQPVMRVLPTSGEALSSWLRQKVPSPPLPYPLAAAAAAAAAAAVVQGRDSRARALQARVEMVGARSLANFGVPGADAAAGDERDAGHESPQRPHGSWEEAGAAPSDAARQASVGPHGADLGGGARLLAARAVGDPRGNSVPRVPSLGELRGRVAQRRASIASPPSALKVLKGGARASAAGGLLPPRRIHSFDGDSPAAHLAQITFASKAVRPRPARRGRGAGGARRAGADAVAEVAGG